ncbi:hypothetical protein [Paracidobacterium acidisoli]|uniref:Uncharacterized protein n=1 Tax=Paracidobacterium acidisoli TaxID=2303751 RepID=A0A372IKX5_9BACT|nr:hypothetical protein [Paracidobacterium acidisoli]MBT9332771.1 hypothetical protein [Paracidobacterium acidisoli]
MLLQIGKVVSFMLSLLSLHALMLNAFFIPGTSLQERLTQSLGSLALAGCMCFASGLLFCMPVSPHTKGEAAHQVNLPHLMETLPVRLFFWAIGLMVVLLLLSWYLEAYYVPLMWRNQPH